MKNSAKTNFYLVWAILLTAILLVPTVYCGISIYENRALQSTEISMYVTQFEKPKLGFTSLKGKLSFEIDESLTAPLQEVSNSTGVPKSYFGFCVYLSEDDTKLSTPKILAVGVKDGAFEGGIIFPTDNNFFVASRNGVFAKNPESWVSTDWSNLSRYFRIWKNQSVQNIAGSLDGFEFLEFLPESETIDGPMASWSFDDAQIVAYPDRMDYTAVSSTLGLMFDNPHFPLIPPLIYLAIYALLSLLGFVMLWKNSFYDAAFALLATLPAIIVVGGASYLGLVYLPVDAYPLLSLASYIAAGLLWSIPLLLLWGAFGVDKSFGLFWLFLALVYCVTILDKFFPYVWVGFLAAIGVTVVILAIRVPVDNRDIRL